MLLKNQDAAQMGTSGCTHMFVMWVGRGNKELPPHLMYFNLLSLDGGHCKTPYIILGLYITQVVLARSLT